MRNAERSSLRAVRLATAGLADVAASITAVVSRWRERAHQRADLARLDARLLDDIGVGGEQAERESSKPFWL